jgi:hypothetical protein
VIGRRGTASNGASIAVVDPADVHAQTKALIMSISLRTRVKGRGLSTTHQNKGQEVE